MMKKKQVRAYLGLGGNLGRPLLAFAQVRSNCTALNAIENCKASALYRTHAMGGPDGQPDYLNAVLQIDTRLNPHQLLEFCLEQEKKAQRKREVRWGPRTLDVDLLLWGEQLMATVDLELPHPRMTMRRFVLQPLADLAPQLRLPHTGKTVTQHLAQLADQQVQLLQREW